MILINRIICYTIKSCVINAIQRASGLHGNWNGNSTNLNDSTPSHFAFPNLNCEPSALLDWTMMHTA